MVHSLVFCKAERDRCSHSQSNLSRWMGTIKTALTGGGDCKNVKEFSLLGTSPRSFINIVEAGKFPGAFARFKNEANRCVFPVVWSILERAVDPILPVG